MFRLLPGTTTCAFVYKGGVVVCVDSRATGGQYIASGTVKKVRISIVFRLHFENHSVRRQFKPAQCFRWELLYLNRVNLI